MCGADTFYTVKSIFLVFPHLYTYTQLLSKRKDPLKECCILEVAYCTVLYLGAQRAPKSPLEELEVGSHRPLYLLVN